MIAAFLSLALAAAPGGAQGWTYSTPPLPPGTVCGPQQVRELRDLPLTPATTYAQVVRAWGLPRAEGPAGEVAHYSLTCASFVWLSFEPTGQRRLRRALLFTEYERPPIVILNDLPVTRNRRCNQLRPGPRQSGRMIARVWGPPDALSGSGIERWIYHMRGGGFAQVFPQRGIRHAISCTSYPGGG